MRIVLTLVALLSAIPSLAATHAKVLPDRILTGGPNEEFIPRFATYLPHSLIVNAGETVTLEAESTWDAIEVAGTLRCDRTRETTVRFIHLTILPGGYLDCGTNTDPVLARVRFIVRDVPIDTSKDPYQWGNGLINFGRQTRVGRAVTHLAELTRNAPAGATNIYLSVPSDWQVGDELLLPDMAQVGPRTPIRRESRVAIAAIGDGVITLSKPLDFEHEAVTDPDGAVVLRPRVANLTRSLVIRSENPQGTRGHTVNIGHDATWDIEYNAFFDLGRTRNVTLDSTTADESGRITHIGTNQIARYTSHDHHAQGFGSILRGNVLHGTGIGKWGHSTHGTHDALIENNIALDFPGAGFVTEDGYEVRNVFRANVAAFSTGNQKQASANANPKLENCPGCEGAGFWFRGPHQTIEHNEAWNNRIGMNMFSMFQVSGQSVPSKPGGHADMPFDPRRAAPVSLVGNVTIANSDTGWEQWNTPAFPVVRTVSAHNGVLQVRSGQAQTYMLLRDLTVVCDGGVTLAMESSSGYTPGTEVNGGRIVGCAVGFDKGGGIEYFRLRNLILQNRININFDSIGPSAENIFENVVHKPLGSFPPRYIVWSRGTIWQPGQAVPRNAGWRNWNPSRGTRATIINWQGTGKDYRLYENQQLASAPTWPAYGPPGTTYYCPELGLTAGACWNRYGLAYGGGVVPDDEAIALEGLVGGVARAGLETSLGTPRYVVMIQSPAQIAKVNGTAVLKVKGLLTGDPSQATHGAYVQIDDERPMKVTKQLGQPFDELSFTTRIVSEGSHTIRTWRVDASGAPVPGSDLTFRYVVGTPPTDYILSAKSSGQ